VAPLVAVFANPYFLTDFFQTWYINTMGDYNQRFHMWHPLVEVLANPYSLTDFFQTWYVDTMECCNCACQGVSGARVSDGRANVSDGGASVSDGGVRVRIVCKILATK